MSSAHRVCREEHVWFYEEVTRVLAEVEGNAVDVWTEEIKRGNWQAARDFLARRFRKRWGNSEHRSLQVHSEGDTEIQLVWDDDDQDRYEGERAQSGAQDDQNPVAEMASEVPNTASAPDRAIPADCTPFPAVPAGDPLERFMVRAPSRPESFPGPEAEELLDRRLSISYLAGTRGGDGGWFGQFG